MYTPIKKEIRKIRVEYHVEAPANAKDIYDTIHVLIQDLIAAKGERAAGYDDAWHMIPGDEDIVFYFEYDENV